MSIVAIFVAADLTSMRLFLSDGLYQIEQLITAPCSVHRAHSHRRSRSDMDRLNICRFMDAEWKKSSYGPWPLAWVNLSPVSSMTNYNSSFSKRVHQRDCPS